MSHTIAGIVVKSEESVISNLKEAGCIFCTLNPGYLFISEYQSEDEMAFFLHKIGVLNAASVRTDYFGGMGEQSAISFLNVGTAHYQHIHRKTIDEALKDIGVIELPDSADEFDVVGLGTIRDNQDVLNLYNIQYPKVIEPITTMDELWKQVLEIGRISEDRSLENPVIKLAEELGEIAAEALKMNGYKNSNVAYQDSLEHLHEECADLLITLIDVMDKSGMTQEALYKVVPVKLAKWRDKHILKLTNS